MLVNCGSRRTTLLVGVCIFLLLCLGWRRDDVREQVQHLTEKTHTITPSERLNITTEATGEELKKVHLLLPVSGEVNLCKTLLTASVLGYPVPTLIAWNETFSSDKIVGGGRHLAKIDGVLKWLETQPESKDDDLVMVVDALGGFNYYSHPEDIDAHMEGDAWFQLPLEVLFERYHAVNRIANEDLAQEMGKAYEGENIRQTILFGASKRCTPNDPESSACYAIPESPLPTDLYGKYTESAAGGAGNYTTHRQRYLSSAYIIGPVSDMRTMFRRAHEKATSPKAAEIGSDQAIFHTILGEQEFQREAMRRRYGEKAMGPTKVNGVGVEDVLDPVFPHEVLEEKLTPDDEFGMGIDYWSHVGMQTADNEDDSQWLIYKRPVQEQLLAKQRQRSSCTPMVSQNLTSEIARSTTVARAAFSDASQFSPLHGWDELPLYTNICLGTIPVIINHMGEKRQRGRDWPEMWMQPHGRRLIEEILARGEGGKEEIGGAYGGVGGEYLSWEQLCPLDFEPELYRDYYEG